VLVGFNRLIGYAESHDEERLMYKNLQYGNNTNPAHNVKNLDVLCQGCQLLELFLYWFQDQK
jgi:hypothetical protein